MNSLVKTFLPRKIYLLVRFFKYFIKNPIKKQKASAEHSNITLVYLVQFPEVWNSVKTVYYAGKSKNVNSYVVCIPKPTRKNEVNDCLDYRTTNDAYDFCKKNGIDCIRADLDNGSWFDIDKLHPDYIIYTRPYMSELPDLYRCNNLKNKYKLCYIPYAYVMTEGAVFYTTFNYAFIRDMYLVFVPNKSRLDLCKAEFYWDEKFGYCRFLFLGFPRFDLISHDLNGNSGHTILWLPRWAVQEGVEGQKESHFLQYYKQFIEYAKQNPNIHLIIRPHPLMFDNFIEKGIMTEEEVKCFKEICRKMCNIELDCSKDYLPTIQKANILVADYTSLLAEFFVTGKPIIYCDNTKNLNKEAILMDKTFYHANSFNQVKERIERIFNNQDILKNSRREVLKEIMPINSGSIGNEIMNVILSDYYSKKNKCNKEINEKENKLD